MTLNKAQVRPCGDIRHRAVQEQGVHVPDRRQVRRLHLAQLHCDNILFSLLKNPIKHNLFKLLKAGSYRNTKMAIFFSKSSDEKLKPVLQNEPSFFGLFLSLNLRY